MRIFLGLLLSLFLLNGLAQDKQRLVIQVSDNDPAKWRLALNNALESREHAQNAAREAADTQARARG